MNLQKTRKVYDKNKLNNDFILNDTNIYNKQLNLYKNTIHEYNNLITTINDEKRKNTLLYINIFERVFISSLTGLIVFFSLQNGVQLLIYPIKSVLSSLMYYGGTFVGTFLDIGEIFSYRTLELFGTNRLSYGIHYSNVTESLNDEFVKSLSLLFGLVGGLSIYILFVIIHTYNVYFIGCSLRR